ncbi:MAG: type II secretion system protein [Bacilli bacterium]
MNKNKSGFTLVEVLVVITLIGVLATIAVPAIMSITKKMNERSFEKKIALIESAAEQYGRDNPQIFKPNIDVNISQELNITLSVLVKAKYFVADEKCGTKYCPDDNIENKSGCVISTVDKSNLNLKIIKLTKTNQSVVAKYIK